MSVVRLRDCAALLTSHDRGDVTKTSGQKYRCISLRRESPTTRDRTTQKATITETGAWDARVRAHRGTAATATVAKRISSRFFDGFACARAV